MADYIIEPLDTDPEVLFQNFVEYIQATFPDWNPSEGQLDVMIARYFAMQTAFTADMASRVQRAIYRYLGASLANIQPLPGSAARALVHFVIRDPLPVPVERTLAYGTHIGLTDSDGDIQIFSTSDDLVVAAGAIEGEVEVEAVELGAISNNISGSVQLIELVDWIETGYVVGQSSGGSDPEEDDLYIQRLTKNFALMAPRPILAEDFAVFAQNIPGVWRSAVIDNFRPGTNEVQVLSSDYSGGSFRLTFGGQQTAPIPATATAATVRDAMGALSTFDITDGLFTGGPLPATPITITYRGKYGYADVAAPTIDSGGLLGGSAISISTSVGGTPYATDLENAVGISAVDQEGNPLDPTTKAQLIAYLESTRAQNFILTFVDPAYHQVDINYTARALKNQDPESVRTDIDTSLAFYLDPANWGSYPQQSESRIWLLQPNVRYLELTTIVENTPGVDYTESLTFSLDGSAFNSSNKAFSGAFSLTRFGLANGTVNLPV